MIYDLVFTIKFFLSKIYIIFHPKQLETTVQINNSAGYSPNDPIKITNFKNKSINIQSNFKQIA